MEQAAGALGVGIALLKRAKKAGCPAFKPGGRVDTKEFLKWMAENPEKVQPSGESLKEQKTQEEIRKLRIKNDKDEGKLVLKSDVAAAIRRALGGVAGICEAKLVNEWPTAVAGLDPAQARVYGRRLHDKIMEECQQLSKEFPA